MKAPSVLIVDDEPLMRLSMLDALREVGYEVRAAATGHEGHDLLSKETFDIVITDLRLPGSDGLDLLQTCKQRSPRTEVIVITAHGSVETAIEAMKLGAYDYITKPFSMDELLLIVDRVSKVLALRQENLSLREELEGKFSFQGILGKSDLMRQIVERVKTVAASDAPVLIIGESGTGKELVANAVHRHSQRRDHALIKVSCADLPESVLEAELFGHEKGAFTGATRQKRGRFELAHRGTLFLDEIGALPPIAQDKFTRFLKERRFERMGGTHQVEVDVRLVCATSRDLKKAVEEGRFREDLCACLSAVSVTLPPLRERKDDALVIGEHLLQQRASRLNKAFKGFSPASQELLLRYSFPGNVRELETLMDRAAMLGRQNEEVQPWDLCGFSTCPYLGGAPQDGCGFCREGLTGGHAKGPQIDSLSAAREQFERDYILSALERVQGSRTAAAKLLGLSRKALWEKCKRYHITYEGREPEEE
ncbi:MAG: sigma-54 dependent transcriptional regulator [Nitrospirota bacterium]